MKKLVEVVNLKKYFPVERSLIERFLASVKGKREFVHAVDDISFDIFEGGTFCLVGESG